MSTQLRAPAHSLALTSAVALTFALIHGSPPLDAAPLNLLRNGDFTAGSVGWPLADGLDDASQSFAGWVEIASPGSTPRGSIYVSTRTERGAFTVSQCVPVDPSTVYAGRVDVQSLTAATTVALEVSWFASPGCASSFISRQTFDQKSGLADWSELAGEIASPSAAQSSLVTLFVNPDGPAAEARALFDNVRFGPSSVQDFGCIGPECLDGRRGDRRFAVQVDYETVLGGGASGIANGVGLVPVGAASGLQFWFFDPTNPELLIKVLDGCAINGHFWVYYAAVTNVGFDLRVFDLATGAVWSRTNPDLVAALPQQDVTAFPCEVP